MIFHPKLTSNNKYNYNHIIILIQSLTTSSMDIYLQFLSTITFVRRVNLYSYFIFVMVNLIPNYSMSKSKYVFAFLSYTVFHHLLVPPSLFLSFKYDNCRSFMRHSILKNNLFPFPSKYQHNFQDSPTKCSNLTPSQPAFP